MVEEVQNYKAKAKIHDVVLKDLKTHAMDDGLFTEIGRITGENALQFNHSIIFPGAIKAWHIHHNKGDDSQWDLWYATKPLLVGLYDTRTESPSYGVQMRFMLYNQTVLIPPGVAHGCANNLKTNVDLFYIVNRLFDPADPDEGRLPVDFIGQSFWKMTLG